jgi:hypothetical protein
MDFTDKEKVWLKRFVRQQMRCDKEEQESEKETEDFRKLILSGKLKNAKRKPDYICGKCGKVIVQSWGMASQFPEQKLRCHCTTKKKN